MRSFLSALALAAFASAAPAAGPMQKTQAPGWYRTMVGDIEVTAISDGTVALEPKKLLTRTTPEKVGGLLRQAYLGDAVTSSVNAYLVNTGAKLVLVDAGAATLFGPTLGKLAANLKASGYTAEQVDEVVITHMHPDHVGGLVVDGKPAFPNATVRADQRDADFWLSPATLEKAPASDKPFVQGAQTSLKPYVDAGRFKPFSGATEIAPGLQALPAYGHTPGHTVYRVESKGQRLLLIGDLIHVAAVQFPHPEVTIAFDGDAKAAGRERARIFAEVARSGDPIGASHLSFPGIGRLRKDGQGYVYVPVVYDAGP